MPAASMPIMFDSDRAASRLRDHSASATPSADRTAEKLRRIAASATRDPVGRYPKMRAPSARTTAIWTVCMRKATSALPVRMDAREVGEASRRSHVPHERSLKNEPMMFCTARNEKRIAIDGTACSAPVTPV